MDHSTAELTIGVMTIGFPTLPGILQRRKKKPSLEIINGSAGFHGQRPDHRSAADDRDYFILKEGQRNDLSDTTPQSTFVTEVRGGEEDGASSELELRGNQRTASGGIMKMIKIEQSDIFKEP